MFFLMTLSSSSAYLTYNQLPVSFRNLNSLWLPSLFLFAPLIYLYVMLLIKKISKITVKQSLQIIPFLLFSIISISRELVPSIEEMHFFHNIINGSTLTVYEFVLIQIGLIQMIIYEFYLIRVLKNYAYNIKAYFSDIDKLKLQWGAKDELWQIVALPSLMTFPG